MANKALTQNNLQLDYTLGSVFILKAMLTLKEGQLAKGMDEQDKRMEESFSFIDKFEILMQKSGYKVDHLIKLLKYCQMLQSEFGKPVDAELK